jgi:penicillin-binding protein 1A
LLVVGLVALGVAVSVAVSQLPSYQELIRRDDLGQMIRVRAADGSVIHRWGPSFGEWLTYQDQIPPIMRDAMVAVEDRRFRSHPRASIRSASAARPDRCASRRGQVAAGRIDHHPAARPQHLPDQRPHLRPQGPRGHLALALEWRFSKDQILELYLNRVYFGGGAYGIDAASRRFFGHSATELSVAEAAIIAGPGQGAVQLFADRRHRAGAQPRRRRARPDGREPDDHGGPGGGGQSARRPARPQHGQQNGSRYFIDWVLPQLDMLIDETVQPLDVWTTVDLGLQSAARTVDQRQCARAAPRARWSRSTATAPFGRWSAGATMRTRSTIARPRRRANPAPRSSCSSI